MKKSVKNLDIENINIYTEHRTLRDEQLNEIKKVNYE